MPRIASLWDLGRLSPAAFNQGTLRAVLLLFFLLMDEHPRLGEELPALLTSTGIFVLMTAICAISFLGLIRRHSWRWIAQLVMWAGVLGTVFYYLPG